MAFGIEKFHVFQDPFFAVPRHLFSSGQNPVTFLLIFLEKIGSNIRRNDKTAWGDSSVGRIPALQAGAMGSTPIRSNPCSFHIPVV